MRYAYKPKGICSSYMEVEVEDGRIVDIRIDGGCDGNHKGLASLVRGMEVTDAISRMEGITCGPRRSSCPDQLAQALKLSLEA